MVCVAFFLFVYLSNFVQDFSEVTDSMATTDSENLEKLWKCSVIEEHDQRWRQ